MSPEMNPFQSDNNGNDDYGIDDNGNDGSCNDVLW